MGRPNGEGRGGQRVGPLFGNETIWELGTRWAIEDEHDYNDDEHEDDWGGASAYR